jgi:hypothetical protein
MQYLMKAAEKGPRAVPARGRADRKLGFGINPALNKYRWKMQKGKS